MIKKKKNEQQQQKKIRRQLEEAPDTKSGTTGEVIQITTARGYKPLNKTGIYVSMQINK